MHLVLLQSAGCLLLDDRPVCIILILTTDEQCTLHRYAGAINNLSSNLTIAGEAEIASNVALNGGATCRERVL